MRRPGYVRQVHAQLVAVVASYIVSYHALLFELLLIDIHHNSTRTGLKYVPVQLVSSPHVRKKNSFHKLIGVIIIFTLKIFVV